METERFAQHTYTHRSYWFGVEIRATSRRRPTTAPRAVRRRDAGDDGVAKIRDDGNERRRPTTGVKRVAAALAVANTAATRGSIDPSASYISTTRMVWKIRELKPFNV